LDRYIDREMPDPFIGDGWDDKFALNMGPNPNPCLWWGNLGANTTRNSRRHYYACVAHVDDWIGEILQIVRTQYPNTLIFFTADHGDMIGDHYHWRKCYAYEGSAHIPMLIEWPASMEHMVKVPRSSVIDKVVELRDILPTFLEAANITIPSDVQVDGKSLFHLLRNDTSQWREWIDLEHDICYNYNVHWNALTDGKFKYIFNAFDATELLFDIRTDSTEAFDLSQNPDYQDTLSLWRERLVQQFISEDRGPDFVVNNTLMRRPQRTLYSPHYPNYNWN
jgi:arylsulfatase A-like enzyme